MSSRVELPQIREYFRDLDGTVGCATVSPSGGVTIWSLKEWSEEDRKLGSAMEVEVKAETIWPLPGRPDVDKEDPNLDRDLQVFSTQHLELPDDRLCSPFSHSVVSTYITEEQIAYPRLLFTGVTRSGKSRALYTLNALCYRSVFFVSPTPAVIYRIAQRYRPTILIDEYQGLDKDTRGIIESIVRAGFEMGTVVSRTRDDGGFEHFRPHTPLAIGSKRTDFPEDILNRSISINMTERTRSDLNRFIDEEAAIGLRARLLALRLKVLSGRMDVKALRQKAREIAAKPATIEGEEVLLDDRAISIGGSLVLSALLVNGDYTDDLTMLAMSQRRATEGLRESFEGQVFAALQGVFESEEHSAGGKPDVTRISTTLVAEQLNTDLREQGNQSKDPIHTRKVTNALRALGFTFRTGRSRKSMFDSATFDRAYSRNLSKYGPRGMHEEHAKPADDQQVIPVPVQASIANGELVK
jgi:hypothetical protein